MDMNELFYKDAYMTEFDAKVVSCNQGKKGYEIILDNTAFYPEGGGQPSDHGTLNGIYVFDVKNRDEGIIHYTEEPIEIGTSVHGVIDWERRFDLMQQHTGEHMISGIIHKHYGYDNVGFHLGEEYTLIDFNGPLTWEQLMELEQEANQAIYKNMPIKVTYPSDEELKEINYRTKIELEGLVRIVEVPECDICACCGTHVTRTGEVGIIKCTSLENRKDGVRITLLCGNRAYKDYCRQLDENSNVSHLLSAKIYETSKAVEQALKNSSEKDRVNRDLTRKYFKYIADTLPQSDGVVVMYEEDIKPIDLRELGNQLLEDKKAKICGLFTNGQEGAYNYILLSQEVDLKDVGKLLNERLSGHGGGKGDMIQGTYQASKEEVESVLKEELEKLV